MPPASSSMPRPHGLVTSISVRPSPSIVAGRSEPVVPGVQQPAAEARAVRGHHRRVERRARPASSMPMPHGLCTSDFVAAVAVEVAHRAEAVVGGVQQPPAEPRAVRAPSSAVSRWRPPSFSTPMPQGLRTRISSRPSPSKSPAGPKRLSAGVEQPAAEARAVGRHHQRRVAAARHLRVRRCPTGWSRAGLVAAVAVEIAAYRKAVVRGVEQPAAETACRSGAIAR